MSYQTGKIIHILPAAYNEHSGQWCVSYLKQETIARLGYNKYFATEDEANGGYCRVTQHRLTMWRSIPT